MSGSGDAGAVLANDAFASITYASGLTDRHYRGGAYGTRFQDAARRLVEKGAEEIVVVPMLVSSHSGHYGQIRYLAGETDELSESMHHHLHIARIERTDVQVPIRLASAIDDSPEAAQVLAGRALSLA